MRHKEVKPKKQVQLQSPFRNNRLPQKDSADPTVKEKFGEVTSLIEQTIKKMEAQGLINDQIQDPLDIDYDVDEG